MWGGVGAVKGDRAERVADREWQAPEPIARVTAAPRPASWVSGCHPRAKERRRHRIKGQRTSQAGGEGGGPCSARVHTHC